jgi:hypothetical protein
MTAGEDELEPFVRNRRVIHVVLGCLRHVEQAGLPDEGPVAAQAVDRPVSRGRNQPCARVVRRPLARPTLRRDRERLLRGFLGDVEVAEEADEGGDDAAPIVAEDVLEDR